MSATPEQIAERLEDVAGTYLDGTTGCAVEDLRAAASMLRDNAELFTGTWYSGDDINRLVRDLDVALNGEAGAAKQAMLCDIVSQVKDRRWKLVWEADLIAQSERERVLVSALEQCLPLLQEAAEQVGYGFARPDNPHDFSPDHESCNEEEIAAHKAACEAYDRGEYDPAATPGSISAPGLHILRAPWGIGSYTMRDEVIGQVVDAARAALKAAP